MYSIGDKIVHPMHGAGTIESITTQTVNGNTLEYYILKLPTNNMTLMVPVATCEKIGIRGVICRERANELISLFSTIDIDLDTNWNKRYRENIARIKSGDLDEVVRVIKSLTYRDLKTGLSTGERKILHSAKQILLSELVLALEKDYNEVDSHLDSIMAESFK